MVKIIMGVKGTGKTKHLIELTTKAIQEEDGDVVCIEKEPKLTYDIPFRVRLIYANQYSFGSFEFLKGFISGLHGGNYDITHVFIDSLYKILEKEPTEEELLAFLNWLEDFGTRENVKFTITISADTQNVSDELRAFF